MDRTTRRMFTLSAAGAALARPQSGEDLTRLTLAQASARVRAGTVSPVALTEACLERIRVYNPILNAFITVLGEAALKQARALEAEQRAGKLRGPLHGIPIALKDNVDLNGVRTTGGSAVFEDRFASEDAEVTRRLKAAGAVLIGKTNLHEFAMGGTNATSYYGPVRNPWDLRRNPGGSSGGSGAAVSAGLCYGALGTDTGGSVRIPAAYCGITGLKATYGLVSIRGIIPLTFSLDHCGPMTRTVEDAALMLNAMAGYDRLDIASVEHRTEDYAAAARQAVAGLRVGIARAPFFDHLDPEIAKAVETAIGVVAKLANVTGEAVLPSTRDISVGGEAYAWHEPHFARLSGRYMLPTRRSLEGQREMKAAPYIQGRWKLELLRRTIDDAFSEFDLVVLPTRRRTPRLIEAARKREEETRPMNPETENTVQFNLYGIPAISIPCGFTAQGLPIGLTIAGRRFSEGRVLALARAYEQATEWHKRAPELSPGMPVPTLALPGDPA